MFRVVPLILVCAALNCRAAELWGPIDVSRWRETPCISGRLATEADVKEGRAAFYLGGDPTTLKTIPIKLPACAILRDADAKTETAVIVIQAEETPKMKIIGYRPIDGGNGICTIGELEFLNEPDERFGTKEPNKKVENKEPNQPEPTAPGGRGAP